MQDEREEPIDDVSTGEGHGVSTMGGGIPAGGGALAGQTDGTPTLPNPQLGGTDADTGLEFGPGQSTTTGNRPGEGGPNLDGTGEGMTVGTDDGGEASPPRATGVGDTYSDPRNEEDRRSRHGEFDRTDVDDSEENATS